MAKRWSYWVPVRSPIVRCHVYVSWAPSRASGPPRRLFYMRRCEIFCSQSARQCNKRVRAGHSIVSTATLT